jgi:hypothetical protein
MPRNQTVLPCVMADLLPCFVASAAVSQDLRHLISDGALRSEIHRGPGYA